MKIKLWLYGLLLICSVSIYSQTDTQNKISELNKLAKRFYNSGQLYDVYRTYLKALEQYQQSDPLDKLAHVESLNGLARIYIKEGQFEEADTLLKKALSLQNIESEHKSLEYAETLHVLAKLKMELNQYDDVENYLKKTVEIRKKQSGKMHIDYSEAIIDLSYYYLYTSQFDMARKYVIEALTIREKKLGKNHIPISEEHLNNKGTAFANAFNNPDMLKKFHDDARKEGVTKIPVTVLEYINPLKALGAFNYYTGDYYKAEENYRYCMSYIRFFFGVDYPDYAEILLILSSLKLQMGKINEATKLVREACDIYRKIYYMSHVNYAYGQYLFGVICSNLADYQNAESFLLESLRLTKKIVGEKHSYYFNALSELAVVYQKNGMYENAEQYLLKSLALRKEVYGEQHPSIARLNYKLAAYYIDMFNYEKAEKLLEQAIRIEESLNGNSSAYYANMLSALALVYKKNNQLGKSLYFSEKATSLLKKIYGETNHYYLSAWSNLVNLQSFLSITPAGYQSTEDALIDICTRIKKNLGENHPNYATTLNNLAQYYEQYKRWEEAEILYKKILTIIDSQNPIYLTFISNFGINQHHLGKIETTQHYYAKVIQMIKNKIENTFLFISENELAIYWNTLKKYAHFHKTFLYQYKDSVPDYSGFIYDNELFSKTLLLNSIRHIRQSIIENGGEEDLDSLLSHMANIDNIENELMKNLKIENQSQLQDYLKNSKNKEFIKMAELLNKEREQISQIEKRLALQYQDYNKFKTEFSMQWQEIQKTLNNDEIAIEYFHFNYYDVDSFVITDTLYCALLLRAGEQNPQMIPLCNERELQTAILQSGQDAQALYPIIWAPIEEHLKDVTHIYIAPTGLLHSVSFAGIRKGNRYLCDDFTIHNLLSTKDIIRLKTKEIKTKTTKQAVLFGGADYGLSPKEINLPPSADKVSNISNLNRSMLDYIDLTRGQGFSYLPGSKKEVQDIEKLLSNYHWKTMLFTGIEANEARVKSFSSKDSTPSPQLIHISTHGFFLPLPQNNGYEGTQMLTTESYQNVYRLTNNPLMRTGLVFTGANHVWIGGDPIDGMDDGILTAYEISNMNLTHTELVVLSACNTGLGDIDGSEGVFGLQRAFRLAGVQTMIVSLWEAPDKETAELMTEFYAQWMKSLDKKQAFTQAQLKMRHLYPDHPEKWAGFIMIE